MLTCAILTTLRVAFFRVEAAADAPGAVLRLFDQEGANSPGSNGGCNTSKGIVSKTPPKRWFSPKAATAGGFSAICLLSAVKLMQANPTVPVGAIESCFGGTRVEAWTPSNWPVHVTPSTSVFFVRGGGQLGEILMVVLRPSHDSLALCYGIYADVRNSDDS